MNTLLEIEGPWEEVCERADELRGRRVRVTVLEAAPEPETSEEPAPAVDPRVAAWLADLDAMQEGPPIPPHEPHTFGDALVEKYRKQGLRLRGL